MQMSDDAFETRERACAAQRILDWVHLGAVERCIVPQLSRTHGEEAHGCAPGRWQVGTDSTTGIPSSEQVRRL
jgi:hypothetical protein